MRMWMQMLRDTEFLDAFFGLSVRDCKLCFLRSKMEYVDDLASKEEVISLSFVDFLEALSRVAFRATLPSDEMIQSERGCDTVYQYVVKCRRRGKQATKKKGGMKRARGKEEMLHASHAETPGSEAEVRAAGLAAAATGTIHETESDDDEPFDEELQPSKRCTKLLDILAGEIRKRFRFSKKNRRLTEVSR